jgi:SAM-dependent methyltransferase
MSDLALYAVEARVEATHWWFVGRRKLFARELAAVSPVANARVLDVGTGAGSNLRMLRDAGYHNVVGLDASDAAISFCAKKGFDIVRKGDICEMPFGDGSMDIILATDVVEHVDDDARAVREIERVLAPGGTALLTVPAFQCLWGLQDEKAFHKRRYRLREFERLLMSAGLVPVKRYYFNYLLFVPLWLARQVFRIFKVTADSESEINTPLLNLILSGVFAVDTATARFIKPPFGVSILAVVKKGPAHD